MVAKYQFKIESTMMHKEMKADIICNFADLYGTANMVNH